MFRIFLYICFGGLLGMQLIPERAHVEYYNRKYYEYLAVHIGRAARRQPYTIDIRFRLLIPTGNNITISFQLLERMSSGYHPTPFQMTFKCCEFYDRDPFFGQILKDQLNITCPFPIGEYHFKNVMLDMTDFPYSMPFAWMHQVSTEVRLDVFSYVTGSHEDVFKTSSYLTIMQKPTLKHSNHSMKKQWHQHK